MEWQGCQLTYCLNIHPGESFAAVDDAIRGPVREVKKKVSPNAPFGLGLRLSAEAAAEMENEVEEYQAELDEMGMYVFTINGFPHGRFHGEPVKEEVYEPDWGRRERVEYTQQLIRILGQLLPARMTGTISTVPLGYGTETNDAMLDNLLKAAEYCVERKQIDDRKMVIALEPEPDCVLSTTEDVLEVWPQLRERATEDQLNHLGVCLDCCHVACEFEDPSDALRRLEEADIPVPKIQVSAVPVMRGDQDAREILEPFDEEVYLHQTRVCGGGEVRRYPDLPDALEDGPDGEWRVHFHVPLGYEGEGELGNTADQLGSEFWEKALSPGRHLEIETYSFDVLPDGPDDVVESICHEFRWMMEQADV